MKYLKQHLVIIALLLLTPFSFLGQSNQNDLTLEQIAGDINESITSETQHFFFRLSNTSNSNQEIDLSVDSISCDSVEQLKQSSLQTQIFNRSLSKEIGKVDLAPNQSVEFIVKTTRTSNSILDTWSCHAIVATSEDSSSNELIISVFIAGQNFGH